MSILAFFIALLSSTVGAICGIGGGVIIKPVMDLFQMGSVPTISFLSSCTVLSMSCYSVGKAIYARERRVELAVGTPLAIGAAIGGLAGTQLFAVVKNLSGRPDTVGAVQSACLAVITLGTLLYTAYKAQIPGRRLSHPVACVTIGLALGICSSFLGIGGGPINLVVLYYFFNMDTKTAAANSLYIILFSQTANFLTTLATGAVPAFQPLMLAGMVVGGIGGGMIGRAMNRKMNGQAVERLFTGLMAVIILISMYNCWRFLG